MKPVSLESEGSQGVVERLADPLMTGVSPELLDTVLACTRTCMEELDVTFGASDEMTLCGSVARRFDVDAEGVLCDARM